MGTIQTDIVSVARAAREAAPRIARASTEEKHAALRAMAQRLRAARGGILSANAEDVKAAGAAGLSGALIDRLRLTDARIEEMVRSVEAVIELPDPVGEVMRSWRRPNGLEIRKVRVPLGVVGIIYESRPNVTSDCIALCLKSGNAVILKGGKEAIHSNTAIFKVLRDALKGTVIPPEAINLITSTDRQAVHVLLQLEEFLDVIVPRGGEELIRFVAEHSKVPVIKHYKGVCHVYVSDQADLKMAHAIAYNAKVQRPGVCNAMETLLVHKNVAQQFLPGFIQDLHKVKVEVRGDSSTRAIVRAGVKSATEKDWRTEYLDLILSVRVVDGTPEAIEHINTYGSHHSDTIVTADKEEGRGFLQAVDSACVYVNASTRFTDGYEFGFGAEVGISTDKLHVRGPMALEGLTTYKYEVLGQGQVRK